MTQVQSTQQGQWIELMPSPKWVRVVFGGEVIADSKRVQLVRESGRVPVYSFPIEDVRTDLLLPTEHTAHSPLKGDASFWRVKVGDKLVEDAVFGYPDPLPEAAGLKEHLSFEWNKMDAWYEENEQVYVHARDPYKRIDLIHSTRHVQVVVGGEVIAESHKPALLFETGLLTRYYLPKLDVRMDLLLPSDTVTRCPYKGEAHYYSAAARDNLSTDIAWYYTYPTTEVSRIAGMLCFFNERVDALYVDGEILPKPQTSWSR